MSVGKCPCKPYFTNKMDVSFNVSRMDIFPDASFLFGTDRPFVPVAIIDPNTLLVDFAQSKTFLALYRNMMNDILSASYNFLADSPADPKYTSGSFGVYLSERIGVRNSADRQYRYDQISNFIADFWTNLDTLTAGDPAKELRNNSFNNFLKDLPISTDVRYWAQPGNYHTSDPDPTNDTCELILAANPTWDRVPVLLLQLDSIA
jgi:hypothetical protein